MGVVPPQEFKAFLDTMKAPLPTTFRIVSSGDYADVLQQKLRAMERTPFVLDGTTVPPPNPMPWYPNSLAWHFTVYKKALKKSPEFAEFHQFLTAQNDEGNIVRQEAVSMVPPLFLDVQRGHTVAFNLFLFLFQRFRYLTCVLLLVRKQAKFLSLCVQEILVTYLVLKTCIFISHKTEGAVFANDSDRRRCYMLVHQTKRLGSPLFLVTNHRAESFPKQHGAISLEFDRILCDVPCTGDGTMRKNPDIWNKWHPTQALGQHKLQARIAERGAQLLKVGGRMVYSTCSLHPAEDEAVVAFLLRRCQGLST